MGWAREVRRAVRSLSRQRGFALIAILTLALGIGANTAIFSVIDGALLRPLPYDQPDRIVYLSDGHEDFGGSGVDQSIPNLLDLRERSRLLESVAIFGMRSANLATEDRPERVRVLQVTHEMLGILGVAPARGRDLLPEDDISGSPAVAILTDATWRARFGADPDIVGQVTTMNSAPLEIIGVLPPDFSFLGAPDAVVPLGHIGKEYSRGTRGYSGVGRLSAGAQIPALRDELQSIFAGLVEAYPEPNTGWYTWADPIRDVAIPAGGQSLFLFAGAVGLVLLIACVNVANLLIVRAESRQREFALRYSLGASRTDLLPLFLSEGLVLSVLGGATGIVTAGFGLESLVAFFGNSIPRGDQIHLSANTLAVGVGVSLLVGLLVGVIPLLRTRSENFVERLKDGTRGSSGRGSRLGGALVMTEVALAVVLVSSAALLAKSVWRIQDIELGIVDPDRVLTFQMTLPEAKYSESTDIRNLREGLLRDLQRLPGVESAALVNRLPLMGGYNTTNFPTVADPDRAARFVSIRSVTPDYFETLGVPLLAGRWLTSAEFEDEDMSTILVNQTLATQLFADQSPLGEMVAPGWAEGGLRIVGVVGDIMGRGPTSPPPPAFFYPASQGNTGQFSVMIKARTRDPYEVLPDVRRTISTLDAEVPMYQIRTIDEIAEGRLGTRRVAMSLFGGFATLALLLGAVGIYGVMSYSVSQRSQELGVRLALGASRRSVFALVLGHGARITLPGVVMGVLVALASARVLSGLLYEVSTLDPVTYVSVAGILVIVSILATYLPAHRATRADPLVSMRSD